MRILLFTQYYEPETVGPAIWLRELAHEMVERGNEVIVLTTFPHHPKGEVFPDYRGNLFQRETIDGIEVIRTWLHAMPSKKFWNRALSFFSFTVSSLIGGLFSIKSVDVIYTILQPLTLGPVAVALGKKTGSKVVLNIQDIHPHAAVAMGALSNPTAIRILERLERWNYRRADRVVVISEGFRENLLEKGVPPRKVDVVHNWADPDFIRPGPKQNGFREELGVGNRFTLVYSGGLTHNSNLEPVVAAAELLQDEPFEFVIVGDGVRKEGLMRMAREKGLTNVHFRPFQPLERYPEVLNAADMNLVTLSSQAKLASVPSKIYKQMAAGRPILAITDEGNEVHRLAVDARFGPHIRPDDPEALANTLRWAAQNREELAQMGRNGRSYLEKHFSRSKCVAELESVLKDVVADQ